MHLYLPWQYLGKPIHITSADGNIDAYGFRPALVGLHVNGTQFRTGNLRNVEVRTSSVVAKLSIDCRISSSDEKNVLLLETRKQVDKYLRKNSLARDSLTICIDCRRRILVLDAYAGFCGKCKRNVCIVCCQRNVCIVCCQQHSDTFHTNVTRLGPPELLTTDLNWDDIRIVTTGLVNGVNVTKNMLASRLRDVGRWEPGFKSLKKAALLQKVKDVANH